MDMGTGEFWAIGLLLLPGVLLVLFVVYRYFRYGGYRGVLRGSAIDETVGEIKGKIKLFEGSFSTTLRVNLRSGENGLGQNKDICVEIEWVERNVELKYVVLKSDEARQLVGILEEAIQKSGQ